MELRVPFSNIREINIELKDELRSVLDELLESGQYILGTRVQEFENQFAQYCNAKYCIGVNSGLDALIIILEGYKALGRLKTGDHVIVPANTFFATVLAISRAGLIPILTEPDPATHNLTVNTVKAVYTSGVRAIMAVDLYGRLAPMTELKNFCLNNGLILIEDAAQAHGATDGSVKAGSHSDAAGLSFYPGKNLGALGDAGAIVTSDPELYEVVKCLRNNGASSKYVFDFKGFNSRMDELQAGFLLKKLKLLDGYNESRRLIAQQYEERITNPIIIKPLHPQQPLSHVWHLYVIRCEKRNELAEHMLRNGVETLKHYPISANNQKCYPELKSLDLPLTQQLQDQVLSIPIHPWLDTRSVQLVADTINSFEA